MIPRTARPKIEAALARQAAVALIGPRQVGKTTLAHEIAGTRPSIYLDLEATADRNKLSDPVLFLVENLITAAPSRAQSSFYRTAAGAEIDLLLEFGGKRGTWAIEIKRGLAAKPQRGFYNAVEDLQPAKAFVVHAGEDSYPLSESVEAVGLREMIELLSGTTTTKSS